jgi:nicotinate phosphoribosyltransferase
MTGLLTDLYELRMAAAYLRRGMRGPATFSLFARRLPRQRGFLVAAGLAEALEFLERFEFDPGELDYLRDVIKLDRETLAELRDLRFTGDVHAVAEGRCVGADEPLLEVTAPIAEAQLVETALLAIVTFHTTIASKAVRSRVAAPGAQLIDFAFRRTHGVEAAMGVSRAAAIAGFDATSNTAAARRYRLRAAGTMAHSFVEAFDSEQAAFAAFAVDFPDAAVFLVDTYDTLDGVRAAIDVIRDQHLVGPVGIRLDSGDLGELARRARRLLDDADLPNVRIMASGGLDELSVAELVAGRAPIDAYGIGTRMGVSADAASLDSAYKLVAYGARPVRKLSPDKVTLPGAKQIYRAADPAEGDVLALRHEQRPADRLPLLEPVMRNGVRVHRPDPAEEVRAARERLRSDLAWLPRSATRLRDPEPVHVELSNALRTLTDTLAHV